MTTAEATFTGTLTTASTYQVVTQAVNVPYTGQGVPAVFTLTAPAGLVPLSGGWHAHGPSQYDHHWADVVSSYPNGADGWTWEFYNVISNEPNLPVDLYLVCASL